MLNTVFMGTPDLVMPALETLYENSNLKLVVTGKDKRAGRGKKKIIEPAPKIFAKQKHIDFLQIDSSKDNALFDSLERIKPDMILVFAFGFILPDYIFDIPKYGTINIHTSLLPKYRGASPVYQALLNRDKKTGVSFQRITEKLDCGDILFSKAVEISPDDDYFILNNRLSETSAQALKEFLVKLEHGELSPMSQEESKATYCKKIQKHHAGFTWDMQAEDILAMVKAYSKWPVAHVKTKFGYMRVFNAYVLEPDKEFEAGVVIKADKKGFCIGCKKGSLCITELQPENKRRMDYLSFLNGHSVEIGEKL